MTDRLPRVSPPVIPARWDAPAKPPADALPAIVDAFRQTGFQLGEDLRLLHEGMNLHLRIAQESYAPTYRTHAAAAGLLLWSRAFLAMSDAIRCATYGAYSSAPPLIRLACECLAAAHQAHTDELPAFTEWLAGALLPDEAHKAIAVTAGQFMAGSTLVREAELGAIYRLVSELSRPHFGVALLYGATDSNRQKFAVAFADQAFHVGLAQLSLGWAMCLCVVQLDLATRDDTPYACSADTRAAGVSWRQRAQSHLARPDRCHAEEITDGHARRWLLHNVRRQASGAPKRLLL